MELKGFVFCYNLIKLFPLMFPKYFKIAIWFGGSPTKKYFIVKIIFVTALGTKPFVRQRSSDNANCNEDDCWHSYVIGGSEHALDYMCLTKAAKLCNRSVAMNVMASY